jgi:glycosyltransferase involved in cell wall biosynthesis
MNNPRISVILNVYKRSINFGEQLNAILNQSIEPLEILVWENGTETVPDEFRKKVTITRSSTNFGVWARFAYALNSRGEFVCIFDDDTIPGNRWLENCYTTFMKTPGLLGTRGVVFENQNAYSMHSDVGVYGPNVETEQVDIVGHSWFFKKDWLGEFWGDLGNRFLNDVAGEDIHFSFVVQQRLNLPTLVPPHPVDDLSLWGSDPGRARKLGAGQESISQAPESLKRFENALQHYRKLGFKTLVELKPSKSKYPNFFYFLIQKFPRFSHELARRIKRLYKQ